MFMSAVKTAELIEMLHGWVTWVGPKNHELDGDPDLPRGRCNFWELPGSLKSIASHCCSLYAAKKSITASV